MRAPIRMNTARALCLAWLVIAAQPSAAQSGQGVTKTELVVGTIQDLSGPMSLFGRELRNGLVMRANEINRQGGVNGRQIKLVVEDSGNDPARVASIVADLVNVDHVFAVLGQMGAAQNLAALPIELEHDVINFLPVTGVVEMYEPPSRLKVAFWPSYQDQTRTGMLYLAQHKPIQHPCIVFQDDDFGTEVLDGASSAARQLNLALIERVSVKRGSSDLATAPRRLKAAACDLVVLGLAARDTLLLIEESRRVGVGADFLGTSAIYSALHQVPGGHIADGLYAMHTVSQPYRDDASKLVRDWAAAYANAFHEEPAVLSVYGYYIMDLFAKVATKAGPTLSIDSFETVLEATTFPRDMFGSPEFHVSATDRLGSRKVRISESVNGRWTPVTTLLDVSTPAP